MEDYISVSDSDDSVNFVPDEEEEVQTFHVLSIDVGRFNLGYCVVESISGAILEMERIQLFLPQGAFNAQHAALCVVNFADGVLNRFPIQKVLIERQITNTKNGMLEFMLHGFFNGKVINCVSIDPVTAKHYIGEARPSYHSKKKRCIRFVEEYLTAIDERFYLQAPEVGNRFFGMIKKDDIADALIQVLFDAMGVVTIPEYPPARRRV